ncbi:carbon-nitrogen hydrolase family protein [Acidithiobacillus caldus]|uniref:nitrilase-related carbon-nitrogen hydrolase n=1 Tax=Acidithiobacillus caldus TaxID=33059 RepID=UPI001C075105|nr:nitrilase-related carbon-nitrogen hydrolase [Acidithiobacillus caldus]MBU2770091.1 conjugal transfer protein TraB [Acidithiobacillus caldus]
MNTGSRIAIAAALGWFWEYGHWGAVLSVLLIPLVVMGRNKLDRYAVASAYYLAGSHGIPGGAAVFFGHGHLIEGIFLWLTSSALLAAGWAFADRPWRVAAVLVLDALPPLGFFDWLSPLAAAGVLFPGMGSIGLLLFLVVAGWTAWFTRWLITRHKAARDNGLSNAVLMPSGILALVVTMNITYSPLPAPAGWIGVDQNVGPITGNMLADMERGQRWIAHTESVATAGSRVILLPESMDIWWAGNADEVKNAVPKGQTWLVGASVPVGPALMADGIEAVSGGGWKEKKGAGEDDTSRGITSGFIRNHGARLLFVSPFPVPVSMWHPWHRGHGYYSASGVGFEAGWWEPVQKIDGIRAWASICYDQLLPWVWMEGVVQSPQVILATNNEWWARGTGIPEIQAATAWAWARLMGVPVLEAENG